MPLPPPSGTIASRGLFNDLPAGTVLCRAHPHSFGSSELDDRPSSNARFSSVLFRGKVVPVAYLGENAQAAASETIFHTVGPPGAEVRPRRVFIDKYATWQWSEVAAGRALRLLRLDDAGLKALGLTRAELIDCDQRGYPLTRQFAERALVEARTRDGMWWLSRQDPRYRAFVLFGKVPGRSGGVLRTDLVSHGPADPFALSAGLAKLDTIAEDLDIDVIRA